MTEYRLLSSELSVLRLRFSIHASVQAKTTFGTIMSLVHVIRYRLEKLKDIDKYRIRVKNTDRYSERTEYINPITVRRDSPQIMIFLFTSQFIFLL